MYPETIIICALCALVIVLCCELFWYIYKYKKEAIRPVYYGAAGFACGTPISLPTVNIPLVGGDQSQTKEKNMTEISKRLEAAEIVKVCGAPYHKIDHEGGVREALYELIQSFTGADGFIQHFTHRASTFEAALEQAEKAYAACQ